MFLFRKKGMYRPMIPLVVAVLSLMIISIGNDRNYDSGLTVGAVDVGQGQCITVFDGEITVMADCGGNYDAGDTAARWLYSHGRNHVDLLIISHFDEDHVNGVVDLMMQIPIKEIIYSVNNITENEMAMINRIQDYADKQQTKITLVNRPKDISLDSLALRLFVTEGDDSNDGIIVSLQSGNYRMMIMGDADFEAENQIMWDSSVNDIDCLVIGHHGSKHSTSKEFLERTNPETAIISSGYNPYGHPSDEVIDRLTDKNVVIYRTDQVGSIEIKVR
jgi:competence protein ComEC